MAFSDVCKGVDGVWGLSRLWQGALDTPGSPGSGVGGVVSRLQLLFSCFSSPTPCDPLPPARLLRPWNFPGKNTGVGCCFLLQGISLTQGLNLCLLYILRWQADSLPLLPPGKPLTHYLSAPVVNISVLADPLPTSFLLIPLPSSVPVGLLTVG